jgi:hypothetical protein
MNKAREFAAIILIALPLAAFAAIDPNDHAERWWDASRADRIDFSDRAAAACKPHGCDSLDVRSCINDTVKPPLAADIKAKTIAAVTAKCVADLKLKQ